MILSEDITKFEAVKADSIRMTVRCRTLRFWTNITAVVSNYVPYPSHKHETSGPVSFSHCSNTRLSTQDGTWDLSSSKARFYEHRIRSHYRLRTFIILRQFNPIIVLTARSISIQKVINLNFDTSYNRYPKNTLRLLPPNVVTLTMTLNYLQLLLGK